MRLLIKMLSLLSFCLIVSCGKSDSGEKNPSPAFGLTQNETIMADGSNIKGIYATDLYPMNFNLHLAKVGMAAVQREGDNFSAFVKMKYGQKQTVIKQAIYTGRRCPNNYDDLNKDAYIDIQEALIAIGQITIPLDSRIDSQQAGLNDYPIGDINSGKYFYKNSTSFQKMFADLKDHDENLDDNIIKLAPEAGLTFPGRIILLQGLNEDRSIPDTVVSIGGESAHKTIPIACGVLWRVSELPDELQTAR